MNNKGCNYMPFAFIIGGIVEVFIVILICIYAVKQTIRMRKALKNGIDFKVTVPETEAEEDKTKTINIHFDNPLYKERNKNEKPK